MTSIANEYERWFEAGHRDLAEFLTDRKLDDAEFRECVMTDQYLRHQCNEPLDVSRYAHQLDRVAASDSLQIDLYLEAFGYLEERSEVTAETRQEFLNSVPSHIRADVEAELGPLSQPTSSPVAAQPDIRPANVTLPESERYRIDEEIGRGAFGTVYRAWDTQLERVVAFKVLHSEQSSESLFEEARLAAGLDVPGIVSVYDCGVDAKHQPYLVTALIEGPDFREWSASVERSDRKRICRLFIRLCESLRHAHDAGIVHRDIKPTNIVVRSDDQPVLLDFGLAIGKRRTGREGELVGTPAYMSPEQARGEGHLVDARSDVFALGILLMETLTRQRPWESNSSRELVKEIAGGHVRSARQFDTTTPVQLERICSKATAASMSERYASASEFAEDLKWFCENDTDKKVSSSQRGAIAPRGLRPYTNENAEAFWQLLPGQRNGRGVPDSVQWWLEQLGNDTPGKTRRSVLVLYGPSGSGKSSLLHAGVVPFLDAAAVNCISVDASELKNAKSLSSRLRADFPQNSGKLNSDSLSSPGTTVAALREDSSQRTLIILDQFEQVLNWDDDSEKEKISRALRQADGDRLQFVLVVRDEFWSATSRLMRSLDAPLREGRNAMALERFNRQHASLVLKTWAIAIAEAEGKAADSESLLISDAFIERAVDTVADDDRIVPIRLALLATLLGDSEWNQQRLDEVTSTGSLSGYYLESALGTLAPEAKQKFSEPAREILRCLTPLTGGLRVASQSGQHLCDACRRSGIRLSDSEFSDVIDFLERQLSLITLAEKDGFEANPSQKDDVRVLKSRFQLPHDFLVTEIRRWLDTYDRSTVSGRAIIDRRAASERWHDDRRPENLAGPIDSMRFGLLTRPRTPEERTFVRVSARRQLLRSILFAAAAFALLAVFQVALLRSHGRETVTRLLTSNLSELPGVVTETRRQMTWTSSVLQSEWRTAEQLPTNGNDADRKDRIALALVNADTTYPRFLATRLPLLQPDANLVFAKQLHKDLSSSDRQAVILKLAEFASDESQLGIRRLKAAIAIGHLEPNHAFWGDFGKRISELLVNARPTDLGWLSKGLYPVRGQLITSLTDVLAEASEEKSRTATFLLAEFAADAPEALVNLIENAAVDHLSAVFPAAAEADEAVTALLGSRYSETVKAWKEADASMTPDRALGKDRIAAMESLRVDFARRIGNLAAAMILRGSGSLVTEYLKFHDDPTIRAYLIQGYAAGRGSARPLLKMLVRGGSYKEGESAEICDDLDVAAALLQMLGNLPPSSQIPIWVRTLAVDIYRTSEDAELNATAEWYLRNHGHEADLTDNSPSDAVGYRTSEGHTMVRLPGGMTTTVGASRLDPARLADEQRRKIRIPEGLYIARDELTAEQLRRFRSDTGPRNRPAASGDAQRTAMRIGFFAAAAYCNWLNQKEGIPRDQWCYEFKNNGSSGMRVVEDHLQRSGYQIPTPDLWEYACRGGTSTPRIYGYGAELSRHYIRWAGTAIALNNRPTTRLPNHFGLFDVLGNSAEWTIGLVDRKRNSPALRNGSQRPQFPPGRFRPGGAIPRRANEDNASEEKQFDSHDRPEPFRGPKGGTVGRNDHPGLGAGGKPILIDAAGKTILESDQFLVMGGAFDSPAHKVLSSDRSVVSSPTSRIPLTLRLMRIVRDEE